MNQIIPARPGRKAFAARRLALLASAAGLAIAVVAPGHQASAHRIFPAQLRLRMPKPCNGPRVLPTLLRR